jgi:predicted nucleic acid-binding protein
MSLSVLLDSGPLGTVTKRAGHSAQVDEAQRWLRALLASGSAVYVPEIADYEVRRELIRSGQRAGLARLDVLLGVVEFLPISTRSMRLAADLWAQARNRGWATAGAQSLDGDVILAAQALTLALPAGEIIVATTNVGHISRYVPAARWEEIAV